MTVSGCTTCATELSPDALACPACGALVHADRLKGLAASAESAIRAGDPLAAREHWTAALALLPPHARQHAVVRDRIADLTRQIGEAGAERAPAGRTGGPAWLRPVAGAGGVAIVLLSKLKFLLLGLTKASTFLSMFAFFGVYWSVYGWPLALGLAVSIYIHEMGHVAMLRRLGIDSRAPLFIPGVGAVVLLKQHVADPITDARIGLAGPVWGLAAGVAALTAYVVTGAPIWRAIAELTAFINLFNLIPIWQLDGSRGFHALGRAERWTVAAVAFGTLAVTGQRLLLLVGGVAVWRALQAEAGPGDRRTLTTFALLVLVLSLLIGH